MPEGPSFDPQEALPHLLAFIREQTFATGRSRLVVGLSGGLDSATAAYLGVRALGSENLTAFFLPYATNNPQCREDAMQVIERLGIEHQEVDITPIVDAYFERCPEAGHKRRGNFMVRIRMAILYDQSEAYQALVLGTGNRTESLLGYTTLWGDMACAFTPLGGLYKTQVRQLAAHLGVPERIIAKPPSADLWVGQTDEGEMGLSYEEVDRLLHCVMDLGYSDQDLVREGFDPGFVDEVKRRVEAASFKRRMPPYPRIT